MYFHLYFQKKIFCFQSIYLLLQVSIDIFDYKIFACSPQCIFIAYFQWAHNSGKEDFSVTVQPYDIPRVKSLCMRFCEL